MGSRHLIRKLVMLWDHPSKPGWKQRTYDYIIVPHEAGDFVVPGVKFVYFDPKEQVYKTIKTEPFSLDVTPSAGSTGNFSIQKNGTNIELLGQDIRYIKTSVEIKPYRPAYTQSIFWFFIILPFPVVPAVLIYGRHRKKLLGDRAYARSFHAKSSSQKRFQTARLKFDSDQGEAALDETAKAFNGYLADRLNLPPGGITLKLVQDELSVRGVSAELREKVTHFWNMMETARFAPGIPKSDTVRELIDQGMQMVDVLEDLKLRKQRHRGGNR